MKTYGISYQITMILLNRLKEDLRQLMICCPDNEVVNVAEMIGDLQICEKVINNAIDYINSDNVSK